MESDSDSGNEPDKASPNPSQASNVSEDIPKPQLEKQTGDWDEEDPLDPKPLPPSKNTPARRALKKGLQEEESPVSIDS